MAMAYTKELTFTCKIEAPPEDVFYAFATSQGWRDWMCDSARFQLRAEGTYQFSWNSGWFTAGTVKELDRPSRAIIIGHGQDDPGYTDVSIQLQGDDEGTQLEISHRGFGEREAWDQIMEECKKGWEIGLENLVSIFDTR
jgi:uncharacterized protein YndB with AHSA1/START domain